MLPSAFTDPFRMSRTTTIGFDDILNKLSMLGASTPNHFKAYPPYNILKIGDNTYVLEMAVAGFDKQNIEITCENSVLTIKGEFSSEQATDEFLHRGIAERNFNRKFTLSDDVHVKSSSMINGMIKIILERILPENKKMRKIDID